MLGVADGGHTLLIVLLIATVMIIGTTAAARVWSTVIRRDNEEELIFRGRQYAQALFLYRKARGTLPPDLKLLTEKGPRGETVLRRVYKDPITGNDFGLVFSGPNNVPIPDEPIEGNGAGGDDDDDGPGGLNSNSNSGLNTNPNAASGFGDSRGAGMGADRMQPAGPAATGAFAAPANGSVAGGMPILGVHSKSKQYAIGPARFHDLERYNQWLFLVTDMTPGAQPVVPVTPNQPGNPGGNIGTPGGNIGTPGGIPPK
jgi:type II secretory pathway pseudopilin PulG